MLRRLKAQSDHLERMFETRSDAWEKVGLAMQTSQRTVRRARREAGLLLPVLIGVLVVYADRRSIFGLHGKHNPWETPIRIITVVALVILGWTLARDIGRAAAPTFFRRMDPATAGTVGFVMRLITVGITLLIALDIAGANPGTLI